MGFGGEGAAAAVTFTAIFGAYLVIAIAAIVVSAILGARSRRAVAWTPVVLVAVLTVSMITTETHPAFSVAFTVFALVTWFWWSWPSGDREPNTDGKTPWHPARALAYSLLAFGFLCALPATFAIALLNS